MLNRETPAGGAGGPSATSDQDGRGAADSGYKTFELPSKLRVHALAKLLESTSREVIATLGDLGEPVRSAQSNITRDVALRVVRTLRPEQIERQESEAAGHAEGVAPTSTSEAKVRSDSRRSTEDDGAEHTDEAPASAHDRGDSNASERQSVANAPLAPTFAAPQAMFLAPEASSKPAKRDSSAAENSTPVSAPAEFDQADGKDATVTGAGTETAEDTGEAGDGGEGSDQAEAEGDQAAGRRRRRRGRRGRGRGRGGDEQGDSAGDEAVVVQNGSESKDSEKSARNSKKDRKAKKGKSEETTPQEAEPGSDADTGDVAGQTVAEADRAGQDDDASTTSRRRRRRRRKGSGDGDGGAREDDPPNTVVHVRETAAAESGRSEGEDEVRAIKGSTRLEAKRQRRRDGREAGRRRAPVLSESEFLARRESVDRKMIVREADGQTQVAVLEDDILVENFVTSSGSTSLVGNVYLGRVQNVLPSMEAAFVDIGRGRNAVLYAGEVDWDAAGLAGKSRRIEQALSTGDSVLVQVTKDPLGHKGARLTTQISLPGRFLVYVPGGGATGISRKLPDNERKRLKDILKRIVPEESGVIIRTASEGTSEEALGRDVRRLQAQWEVIREKSEASNAQAPQLLYAEPDLLIKVVRDLFTEDFSSLVVQGNEAWETIEPYVQHVAPDLVSRLSKHVGNTDVFTEHRVDEQIAKALDRKVWLPSGGYLVVDRTEAMTVIDVNTGKFTGSGGNLEETVTRNNLEAAEEIVRQLRLRDIGGIIVIDFIDMVLESNRDLVLRRLTECLGRDRTRHQVAEVTSLGLVQMTRKRVGTGLLEAYSSTCEHCRGRGLLMSTEPIDHSHQTNGGSNGGGSRRGRNRNKGGSQEPSGDGSEKERDNASGKGSSEKSTSEKSSPDKGSPDKGSPDKGSPEKAASDKRTPAASKASSSERESAGEGRAPKDAKPQREPVAAKEAKARTANKEPVASSTASATPVAVEDAAVGSEVVERAETAEANAQVVDSSSELSAPTSSTDAGSAGTGRQVRGSETVRGARRRASRPTGSAGPSAEPIVVSPSSDADASQGRQDVPSAGASTVSAGVARRPGRRSAGRDAGPPKSNSET